MGHVCACFWSEHKSLSAISAVEVTFYFSQLKLISEFKLPSYWTSRKLSICPSRIGGGSHTETGHCWSGWRTASSPLAGPAHSCADLHSLPVPPLISRYSGCLLRPKVSYKDPLDRKCCLEMEEPLSYRLETHGHLSWLYPSIKDSLFELFSPSFFRRSASTHPFLPFSSS